MSRSVLVLFLAGCVVETSLHTQDTPAPPETPSTPVVPPSEPSTSVDTTDSGTPPVVVNVLTLSEVSWFQVVDVPVIQAGLEVLVTDRPAPLVADRDAVFRALVDVPSDWKATQVEARLEVTHGGLTDTFSHYRDLEVSSSASDPYSGFLIDVSAEAIQPGATYAFSLWSLADDTLLTRFPTAGDADVGAEVTGPIKIHLVPFEIGGFAPDTSAAVVQGYADAVFAVYPTTDVLITVGDVVGYSASALNPGVFSDMLVDLGILQQATPGSQDEYWYGMVTGAASRSEYCPQCSTGSSEDGGGNITRAYFAIGAAFGDQTSEDTLIHELGHVQQLPHAPCGGTGDVDPAYPYAGGVIGSEGYDVRTGTFVDAGQFDMMGYCYPRWISDYNYAQLVDWVQHAQGW